MTKERCSTSGEASFSWRSIDFLACGAYHQSRRIWARHGFHVDLRRIVPVLLLLNPEKVIFNHWIVHKSQIECVCMVNDDVENWKLWDHGICLENMLFVFVVVCLFYFERKNQSPLLILREMMMRMKILFHHHLAQHQPLHENKNLSYSFHH